MWHDKQEMPKVQPDSPMKQMARQLLASDSQENTRPQPLIRRVSLSERFSQDQEPGSTQKTIPSSDLIQKPRPQQSSGLVQKQDKTPRPQQRLARKPAHRLLAPKPRPGRFASLQEALAYARDSFPLPREIQMKQEVPRQAWLLNQIQACHDEGDLRRLAYSLSSQDLANLFPCLAELKTGSVIDKLLRLIALRASKYLYFQGWISLQYTYPRSTVQKGLTVLCEILEDKNAHAYQLERLNFQSLPLGLDRFDWQSVHLISEISLPNTRHFMSSIIKYLRDSGLSGEEFFQKYGIYRDLALGQAIIGQWEMAVFESNLHNNHPLHNLF